MSISVEKEHRKRNSIDCGRKTNFLVRKFVISL